MDRRAFLTGIFGISCVTAASAFSTPRSKEFNSLDKINARHCILYLKRHYESDEFCLSILTAHQDDVRMKTLIPLSRIEQRDSRFKFQVDVLYADYSLGSGSHNSGIIIDIMGFYNGNPFTSMAFRYLCNIKLDPQCLMGPTTILSI